MIEIGNTIVSRELFEKQFVCDLSACKGACCVEGDAGAPLLEEELETIEAVYEQVMPFMREEGIRSVSEQGNYVVDIDGEHVTPLVDGRECAYVNFDGNGTAKCAIEQSFLAGKSRFRKPLSCHLYPVRVTKYQKFEAVNYHAWHICKPACECGSALEVKVYQFVKDALIRRFGTEWYEELRSFDEAART